VAVKLGYKNVYRDPLGFPEWQAKGLPVKSPSKEANSMDKAEDALSSLDGNSYGPLYGWGMIWTLLGIFIGGMALNLTPCVYPLIPITISYFGGRKGSDSVISHGICYVIGIATTNSMLGVFAALTGGLMGALLQHPAVLIIICVMLIFLASSLFGFWELRVPYGLMQTATKSRSGYMGSLFMGLVMGIVAVPCIGPFVLGFLTWVASMGSPWLGFIVFFTLSLGLGLPLFFLAVFSGNVKRLPRSGEWMLWVRKLMGWILMGMAVYFIQPLLSKAIGTFVMAGVSLAAALHLGWIDKTKASFKAFYWVKMTVAMIALVLMITLFGNYITQGSGAYYSNYSDELLEQSKIEGKPVIIDFYADWCAPCRELENITFHDKKVVEYAAENFVLIKLDLTRKGNVAYKKLLKKYQVKGVPTIVFLDRKGKEIKSIRLVDFEPPELFLKRMNKATAFK
jgi:thioredoxin:protein disulfide reductase